MFITLRTTALTSLFLATLSSSKIIASRQDSGINFPGITNIDMEKGEACLDGSGCVDFLTAFTSNEQCAAIASSASGISDSAAAVQMYKDCICTAPIITGMGSCLKCLSDAGALTSAQLTQGVSDINAGCKQAGSDLTLQVAGGAAPTTGTTTNTSGSQTETTSKTQTGTSTSTTNTSTSSGSPPAASGTDNKPASGAGSQYTLSAVGAMVVGVATGAFLFV